MEQRTNPRAKAKGKFTELHSEDLGKAGGACPAKRWKRSGATAVVAGGMFEGVHAFFIARGISRKRLQVWQTRFVDLGGTILEMATASHKSCDEVHILAADEGVLSKEVDLVKLKGFKQLKYVHYGWIEDCLKDGQLLSCKLYMLLDCQGHGNTKQEEIISSIPRTQSNLCTATFTQGTENPIEDSISFGVVDHTRSDEFLQSHVIKESNEETMATSNVPGSLLDDERSLDMTWEDEAPDYNKHVAGPLAEMSQIYADFFGDEWRALTYRKAANKLDKLQYRISSSEDLKNIQGLGRSMVQKIQEILHTGQLQKLTNLKADKQVQIVQRFASVWGIGPKHARRLYKAGYKSLEDVRQDPFLPSMAQIGLKYHNDIILRIPRAEVTDAGAFVKRMLEDLCPGAWLTVGGSYRRGQLTCGDIDLLITHPDGHSHNGLMSKLVGKLQQIKFLSVSPTSTSQIYPKEVYPFALVYFTGNDVLNRRIRYFARTRGYKLSDQGLFVRVGYGKQGIASDVSIPCETEQEIFEKLGLPYPEPQDRNW